MDWPFLQVRTLTEEYQRSGEVSANGQSNVKLAMDKEAMSSLLRGGGRGRVVPLPCKSFAQVYFLKWSPRARLARFEFRGCWRCDFRKWKYYYYKILVEGILFRALPTWSHRTIACQAIWSKPPFYPRANKATKLFGRLILPTYEIVFYVSEIIRVMKSAATNFVVMSLCHQVHTCGRYLTVATIFTERPFSSASVL